MKKECFDYYRQHKNLNKILYSTTDKVLQKKFFEWQKEFHDIIQKEEKLNQKQEIQNEDKLEQQGKANQLPKQKKINVTSHKSNINLHKANSKHINEKKHSFLIGSNVSSQMLTAFGVKVKQELEEEFLDLDEMVEMDFPKEYNSEVSEVLIKELGQMLNENREFKTKESVKDLRESYQMNDRNNNSNKLGSKMKNDDFKLLLCLLRLKKKEFYEITPYYSSYKFDLRDLYSTQIDDECEDGSDTKKDLDIEGYVAAFIENEINN